MNIRPRIDDLTPEMIGWRRHLHAHPELSYQEFGTSKFVQQKLAEAGIPFSVMATTGVVGVIERVRHPRYAKTMQRTKRLYAHDPDNSLRVGDRVRLAETRPVSKLKRWRVVDVLERAK